MLKLTRRSIAILFAFVVGAACAQEKPHADTGTRRSESVPTLDRHPDWMVTPRGFGPLHAGMTRAEAEAVVGGSLAVNGDSAWTDCGYVPADRLPSGVRVMVEAGTVARIDIESRTITTTEGARIGDSEDRIRQLYPTRVVATPHKYTAGQYLTVRPAADADSQFRLVFETDSGRVTRYRAGRVPPVEYVEGCS